MDEPKEERIVRAKQKILKAHGLIMFAYSI